MRWRQANELFDDVLSSKRKRMKIRDILTSDDGGGARCWEIRFFMEAIEAADDVLNKAIDHDAGKLFKRKTVNDGSNGNFNRLGRSFDLGDMAFGRDDVSSIGRRSLRMHSNSLSQ